MAGMFLAPFGMLISKWAVLKAVVDAMPILAVFIVFGSAATLFFWVKWMGKLIEVVKPGENVEKEIGGGEWVALYSLSVLTVVTCLCFPLISSAFIEPYIKTVCNLEHLKEPLMASGNIIIMVIMMGLVALFPLSFINYGKRVKVVDAYLSGCNVDHNINFQGSAGVVQDVSMSNYYFSSFLTEATVFRAGVVTGTVLLIALAGTLFV